jgi:hypothetical protein
MRVCYIDPKNPRARTSPQTVTFSRTSTERAELEHFAEAAEAGRALAMAGGDEVHGVAALEAIMDSIKTGKSVTIAKRTASPAKRAVRKTVRRGTAKRRSKASAPRRGRR